MKCWVPATASLAHYWKVPRPRPSRRAAWQQVKRLKIKEWLLRRKKSVDDSVLTVFSSGPDNGCSWMVSESLEWQETVSKPSFLSYFWREPYSKNVVKGFFFFLTSLMQGKGKSKRRILSSLVFILNKIRKSSENRWRRSHQSVGHCRLLFVLFKGLLHIENSNANILKQALLILNPIQCVPFIFTSLWSLSNTCASLSCNGSFAKSHFCLMRKSKFLSKWRDLLNFHLSQSLLQTRSRHFLSWCCENLSRAHRSPVHFVSFFLTSLRLPFFFFLTAALTRLGCLQSDSRAQRLTF